MDERLKIILYYNVLRRVAINTLAARWEDVGLNTFLIIILFGLLEERRYEQKMTLRQCRWI